MPDRKILLKENDIPKQWYNIVPDLPHPLPPFIDVETKQPGVGISPKNIPQRNHRPRNKPRKMDKHPRRSSRNLQNLETNPTL